MKNSALFLLSMLTFGNLGAQAATDFYSLKATQILEDKTKAKIMEVERDFSEFKGKVLLLVNTASECGYTSQYTDLVAANKKFNSSGKQDFVVLGFPSNDFGSQEPGTDKEIRYFCKSKYNVDFPMFKKGSVNGSKEQPVYTWLKANSPKKGGINWNFEKFLISKTGKVIGRYGSGVKPSSEELTQAIQAALKEMI